MMSVKYRHKSSKVILCAAERNELGAAHHALSHRCWQAGYTQYPQDMESSWFSIFSFVKWDEPTNIAHLMGLAVH